MVVVGNVFDSKIFLIANFKMQIAINADFGFYSVGYMCGVAKIKKEINK